jgi:GMP synthase (glutamine-hydrolysing)
MRVLLVQFRDEQDVMQNEFKNILQISNLQEKDFVKYNGHNGCMAVDSFNNIDAIILCATGCGSVLRDEEKKLSGCTSALFAARDRKIPMLGFNYGAHLLTLAFGGSVTGGQTPKELGSCAVKKEPGADSDPIFKHLPNTFVVQTGHMDYIETIPPGAVHLLSSDKCKYEAWTFPEDKIYALEFQIDLDKDTAASRIIDYHNLYAAGPGELEHHILSLKPSPETLQILPLFFSEVVNKK